MSEKFRLDRRIGFQNTINTKCINVNIDSIVFEAYISIFYVWGIFCKKFFFHFFSTFYSLKTFHKVQAMIQIPVVQIGYEIHVCETISFSTEFLGQTHRETISTWNSIMIINHLWLNTSFFFIKATETYFCIYLFVLWSDLESSRMCHWNKILIPPFGACSTLHVCMTINCKVYIK